MASLGEFSLIGKNLALREKCSCGSEVGECAHWVRVFERVKRERSIDLRSTPYALHQWDTHAGVVIDHAMQTPAYLRACKLRSAWMYLRYSLPSGMQKLLPLPSSLEAGVDNTFYLYDVIRKTWGRKLVIDSSKNVYKALALYERDPAAVRIILLIRDGRGVYHSRRSSQFSRKKSLEGWRRYYHRAIPLLQKNVNPNHLLRLHYETLAADPELALGQVCELLGVPYEAQMLQYSSGMRHSVNGNSGTRFSRHRGIQLDERWKTELAGEELSYFLKYGSKLNRSFGYERDI